MLYSIFSCLPPNIFVNCDTQLQMSEESFSVIANLNPLIIYLCADDLMDVVRQLTIPSTFLDHNNLHVLTNYTLFQILHGTVGNTDYSPYV